MGYTTDFKGHFVFNRPLDDETCKLLTGLAATRRVKRKFRQTDGYGIDGEFYCSDQEPIDQQTGKVIRNIVDDNEPPRTQPSLCLQWVPSADRKELHWDGGEKFYGYVAWLEYLREKILAPRGYSLGGTVLWFGEAASDTGVITAVPEGFIIKGNIVEQGYAYAHKAGCWLHKDTEEKPNNCFSCRQYANVKKVDNLLDHYYSGEDVDVPLSEW